jgi:hypothetical protein
LSAATATSHFGTETSGDSAARFASGMFLHCAARHSGRYDFNSYRSISLLCAAGEERGQRVDDLTMARFPSPG